MSSIISKRKRKESKLTYKQLYEIELNNRKMYEKRYKEICEENIEIQKGSELPKLRLQIRQLSSDLQDMTIFKTQETIAKEILLNRQKEIEKYINKLENKVVEKEYIKKVLSGELDEELKEKQEDEEIDKIKEDYENMNKEKEEEEKKDGEE